MLLVLPASGFAWGQDGHRIIGLIAEHYLKPGVRKKVRALLALDTSALADSKSMVDETVWADRFRDSDRSTSRLHYRQTQAWHYIDLETDHPDSRSACPDHDCIVDKIEEFEKDLRDSHLNAERRLLALQYLLHLIGDLHQPLHAADRHDRGGNDVRTQTGEHPGNLHQDWDTVFVARLGSPSEAVARRLIAGITSEQAREWRSGSVDDWAHQSFALARQRVYAPLPEPDARGVRMLDEGYSRTATAVVSLQLQRAGVRLASVLNAILG